MKKFMITLLVTLFLVLSFFTNVNADSAKDGIIALKKLQAKCQTGISYRDYSNALGEAKFPVNMYTESEESKKYPDLTQ